MTPPSQIHRNPGWLKLELMARGLALGEGTEDLRAASREEVCGPTLFGNLRDLDLILPGGTWASVPVRSGLMATSPYRLERDGDGYAIRVFNGEDRLIPVQIRPPSRLMDHVTATGLPFKQFGTVHGPYMALSPNHHCSFLGDGDRCGFCGVADQPLGSEAVSVEDVVEVVRVARSEHPLDMVVLSVGHLGQEDGGVPFLEPYVAALKKHFDILVGVDGLPPASNGWIDRTYGMGVDALGYNLEIFGEERFQAVCPGVSRELGRQRFLDALGYAASVFPSGAVTCHLMVGLEPIADTWRGIEALTELGVMPVLPVYRPFKGRDLREDPAVVAFAPTMEQLTDLYAHLYRSVRKRGLNVHVVRDVALATTPLDARFFADADGFWSNLQHRLQGSRLARRMTARLADIRRSLRARPMQES